MRLIDLQAAQSRFLEFLHSPKAAARLPLWEAQRIFQHRWDLEAADLAGMYASSLDSTQTRRYWSRDDYQPRQMMHQFMLQQPDFARQMFRDLFREEKSIDGRVSRFVFSCEELWQDHQERHPLEKHLPHDHGEDYRMVFLYLAFRFPETYSMYDFEAFLQTLKRIGAPVLPLTHDIERFVKVSRVLFNFLQKDPAIQEAHQKRLDPARDYMEPSMLLVYDFMEAVKEGDC